VEHSRAQVDHIQDASSLAAAYHIVVLSRLSARIVRITLIPKIEFSLP